MLKCKRCQQKQFVLNEIWPCCFCTSQSHILASCLNLNSCSIKLNATCVGRILSPPVVLTDTVERLGKRYCRCQSEVFPSLLFPLHVKWQITHANPFLSLNPRWLSLQRTHCHSSFTHLSSLSFLLTSQSVPSLLPPASCVIYELIQSFLVTHHFFFFVLSFLPDPLAQNKYRWWQWSRSCYVGIFHASRGDCERLNSCWCVQSLWGR